MANKNRNNTIKKSKNCLKVYGYQIAIDLTEEDDDGNKTNIYNVVNDEVLSKINHDHQTNTTIKNNYNLNIEIDNESNSDDIKEFFTNDAGNNLDSHCDEEDFVDKIITKKKNIEKLENNTKNAKLTRAIKEKENGPFLCHTCGKVMQTKNSLKQHKRTHTGEKPYKCNICKKTFAHGLTYHIRSHTGEKPYKCTSCELSFRTSYHLSYHKKLIHTMERNFICDLCNKSFITAYYLKKHMRSHQGIRDQLCTICGRHLSSKSALTRHIRLKHIKNKNKKDKEIIMSNENIATIEGITSGTFGQINEEFKIQSISIMEVISTGGILQLTESHTLQQ